MIDFKIKGDGTAEDFRKGAIVTKKDILEQIDEIIFREWLQMTANIKGFGSQGYFYNKIVLFVRFYKAVDKLLLFDRLEDWWHYNIFMDDEAVKLNLCHLNEPTSLSTMNDDSVITNSGYEDQTYTLLIVKPRMLTVEEYANRYKVQPGTVRQWIRRGKLRGAKKNGGEWRISELCDIPGRGYDGGVYHWEEKFDKLPEGYEFLNNYKKISIYQDDDNRKLYHYKLWQNGDFPKVEKDMTIQEREKLELFLISSHNTHSYSNAQIVDMKFRLRHQEQKKWPAFREALFLDMENRKIV